MFRHSNWQLGIFPGPCRQYHIQSTLRTLHHTAHLQLCWGRHLYHALQELGLDCDGIWPLRLVAPTQDDVQGCEKSAKHAAKQPSPMRAKPCLDRLQHLKLLTLMHHSWGGGLIEAYQYSHGLCQFCNPSFTLAWQCLINKETARWSLKTLAILKMRLLLKSYGWQS